MASAILTLALWAVCAIPAVHAEDIIRIASPYKVTVLDPIRSSSAGPIEAFGQLYARLLRRDEKGDLAPGLAESWTVSPDGRNVTVILRPAKFSDGSAITASDVVFSIDRARRDPKSAYPAPLQGIDTITAKDERTVVFTLKSAFASFLGNLEVFNTAIVSKKDVEARGEEKAFTENPVVSGPYKVKLWKPNDRLILERNPNYWRRGWPKNDGAELIEIPTQETRVAMLQSGQVDAVRDAPWAQIETLKRNPKLDVPLEPSTVIYMTLLNENRAPFNDVRVRRAAAHAIDTVGITKAVTHGFAKPANTTLPKALLYHDDGYAGIRYDPAKAKALLQQAGPIGRQLVILVYPLNEQLALLVQAQWAAVGIKSKIETVDRAAWVERIHKGDYDASPTWWYNETSDPDLAVRWAVCGTCGNRSFYTSYDNPTVDALVEAGANEIDYDKRRDIYYQIQKITTEDVSQIPLYYPPYVNAYSKRIKGLRQTPSLQWTLEDTEVLK